MLPRVILHNMVSIDGRVDSFLPDIGLFYELAAAWNEEATLAGSETMVHPPDDIPPEDGEAFRGPVREPGDARPVLAVVDSTARVRNWHYWKKQPYWREFVALCSESTPAEYLDYLKARHIDVIVAGRNHVDLREALKELNARYGITTVRVESGGTLNGALLRANLVSEVSLLISPALVGGTSPSSIFRAPDLSSPDGVIPLKLIHLEKMPNNFVWLRYEVVNK